MVGTMIEQVLQELHKAHIELNVSEGKAFYDELFVNPYAPLGHFGGLIQLGYAYGLISAEDYRDLNLIRKIRNEAAHCPFDFSLDDKGICSLLRRLTAADRLPLPVLPESGEGVAEGLKEAAALPLEQASQARLHFVNNGLALWCYYMERCGEALQRVIKKKEGQIARLKNRPTT